MGKPPLLRFLGAAGTVTGSRHLLRTGSSTILVDCGMFQGTRELRDLNWADFPVDPASIDAILLTHAHLDHVGYLPVLVRRGFAGPVIAARWTPELARIVLLDSGHLLEEEAAFANRMGYSKHHPALALYTEREAEDAAARIQGRGLGDTFEPADGVKATFRPAGHILGSATVLIESAEGPRILFSGDLGRPHHPLLAPPDPPADSDVLVVESTYGDRTHEDTAAAMDRLADAISRTARRGGTVVIPAFAVDRTEVLLNALTDLVAGGRIPRLPIYVDSPMAMSVLEVYRKAIIEHAPEIATGVDLTRLQAVRGEIHEAPAPEDSKAIDRLEDPAIVISASGMATGGRVLHHLARRLPDSRNTVILAGYQSEGTRGRALVDGAATLKMLGRYVPVRSEIVTIDAFSVHADASELLAWMGAARRQPDMTYVVHGEPHSARALRDAVESDLGRSAVVPRWKETVRLD